MSKIDVGSGASLHRLSEEVGRIARTLASLSAESGGSVGEASSTHRTTSDHKNQVTPGLVRSLIKMRRLRDEFFKPELFSDPGWDILLDLYASTLEGRPVTVSSLCIAAAAPPTTALRWIKTMTDAKLIEREPDVRDARRAYVRLSDQSAQAMSAYLASFIRTICAALDESDR